MSFNIQYSISILNNCQSIVNITIDLEFTTLYFVEPLVSAEASSATDTNFGGKSEASQSQLNVVSNEKKTLFLYQNYNKIKISK